MRSAPTVCFTTRSSISYDRLVRLTVPSGAVVCLLTGIAVAGAPGFAHAQAGAAVTASRASSAAVPTPLEEFDAALQILRQNFVAERAARIDWDALRLELRPRAQAAHSNEDVRALIREMLDRVGQSHFALLPAAAAPDFSDLALPAADAGSLGFDVVPIDDHLVVSKVEQNGPAAQAGVKAGWILTRVGPRDVGQMLKAAREGQSTRAAFGVWTLGAGLVRGRVGIPETIEFRDDADAAAVRTIVRQPERGAVVKFGHLPPLFARVDARSVEDGGRTIGVIAFNVWMTPIAHDLDVAVDRLRSASGIVIDLRGNPGGVLTMIMGLAGHFLDAPVTLGVIKTRDSELNLVSNPRRVSADGTSPVTPFRGRLAVLVDGGSYSASEIFSAGMQSVKRARIFGARTAGGALPAVLERLPGGDVLQYAIGDFTTAQGDRVEGRGVFPDVTVTPTRADLLAGRDPVLEAAIDWIKEGSI
jgi:carboxyl-terminal processing protease